MILPEPVVEIDCEAPLKVVVELAASASRVPSTTRFPPKFELDPRVVVPLEIVTLTSSSEAFSVAVTEAVPLNDFTQLPLRVRLLYASA